MTYNFLPYDVLQIKRPGRDWSDFATLRTREDATQAVKIVDGVFCPSHTDSSMGWRIVHPSSGHVVYRRTEEV